MHSELSAAVKKARIYSVTQGTQLLVVQHLRLHLDLPPAEEYLIWYPLNDSPWVDVFMREVIASAGFTATLDVRALQSLAPRRHSAVEWLFEAPRRLAVDAKYIRNWLGEVGAMEGDVELWLDDPIHFNVVFLRALLARATQIKFPHCFNIEDAGGVGYRHRYEVKMRRENSWLRRGFCRWLRLLTGCDFNPESLLSYDHAYSFDVPSSWSSRQLDVSHLVSLERLAETYRSLPHALRIDIEEQLRPLGNAKGPVALLLLFGLTPTASHSYRQAMTRVFAEHGDLLRGGVLGIKVHPGARGPEEEEFFSWARASLPVEVIPLRTVMNLELLLPILLPDFVFAGPCGALPVLRTLEVSRPIVLSEVTEELCRSHPTEAEDFRRLVQGMEVW